MHINCFVRVSMDPESCEKQVGTGYSTQQPLVVAVAPSCYTGPACSLAGFPHLPQRGRITLGAIMHTLKSFKQSMFG